MTRQLLVGNFGQPRPPRTTVERLGIRITEPLGCRGAYRRDEGWLGEEREGGQQPQATPPGYSPRGNSTRGNALWVLHSNRATGCTEEGRGWWRRGGGTYRQPLRSESRLGSGTGPNGPQAVGLASLGNSVIRAPLDCRLLGNFKQPDPPPCCRNPLFWSICDGRSHSSSDTTTKSPAPGFPRRGVSAVQPGGGGGGCCHGVPLGYTKRAAQGPKT